ncbi:MAG: histidine kinase, partial [Burkholderiales bacterium]|nr:histidine kinase [Phycisphaerae bacterium]
LAKCLGEEQQLMLAEVTSLSTGIDHIKQIVAAQQSMAKKSDVQTPVDVAKLIETAINMQGPRQFDGVQIERNYSEDQSVLLDQHKVLQILINLISNARQAVACRAAGERKIGLCVEIDSGPDGSRVRFGVSDNGVGIARQNLAKIFAHGFTTKKEGHGFGLHGSANSAREMGGTLTVASEGIDQGATFTLEIPVGSVLGETCKL